MGDYFSDYMIGTRAALEGAARLGGQLERVGDEMVARLTAGGTVYFLGNGGSASDAQHLAAELMGRFARDRSPLRSVCLNTDTSVLTALANDYGYEHAFERQVHALVRADDVVALISTSGESPSVLAAMNAAHTIGALTIGLTGSEASTLARGCGIALAVGTYATCHIQEALITLGQALCGYVENQLFPAT